MKIIFAGTPLFSVAILNSLIISGHTIVGVYCQPDRPKGRGRKLTACPVKQKALEYDLDVYQPQNLKDKDVQQQLLDLDADVMVVVAYGQLLPIEVLQMPKHGCLNIHASLLPSWRGAAPIARAILAGDKKTGISIMQMDEGLDTGDVLLKKECEITSADTSQTLHDKLATLGAKTIIKALDNLSNLRPKPQAKNFVTYAKKLSKNEAWINWGQSAKQINRQIRSFNPYPIAQTNISTDKFDNKVLRILSASVVGTDSSKIPGEVIKYDKGVCHIATKEGILSLEKIQLAGKNIVLIKDFTNAYKSLKIIH